MKPSPVKRREEAKAPQQLPFATLKHDLTTPEQPESLKINNVKQTHQVDCALTAESSPKH